MPLAYSEGAKDMKSRTIAVRLNYIFSHLSLPTQHT